MMDLEAEAARRTSVDGIPRYVTPEGKIMKCDWELTGPVDELDGESLEEHIARLLSLQF